VIQSGQWEHVYCHMQGHVQTQSGSRYLIVKVAFKFGRSAGERWCCIGRVGMTGRSTGSPALGLKYANNYIDPALPGPCMHNNLEEFRAGTQTPPLEHNRDHGGQSRAEVSTGSALSRKTRPRGCLLR